MRYLWLDIICLNSALSLRKSLLSFYLASGWGNITHCLWLFFLVHLCKLSAHIVHLISVCSSGLKARILDSIAHSRYWVHVVDWLTVRTVTTSESRIAFCKHSGVVQTNKLKVNQERYYQAVSKMMHNMFSMILCI